MHLTSEQEESFEKLGTHAALGNYLAWLQQTLRVKKRRLTNANIFTQVGMSSSTYSKVKKGFRPNCNLMPGC